MKYAIVIPDGCADEPQASLANRTPLQAADTPAMDEIARRASWGVPTTCRAQFTAGSAVANMSLLGYDVHQYFTGRAPIEAAALGIELGPDDWAIRCNLVTIEDQVMRDFTAGHISTDEARHLLHDLQAAVGREFLEFVPGVSYRNLVIYRGGGQPAPFSQETIGVPPTT